MEENLEAMQHLQMENKNLKESLAKIEGNMAKMEQEQDRKLDYFVETIELLTDNIDTNKPEILEKIHAVHQKYQENIKN